MEDGFNPARVRVPFLMGQKPTLYSLRIILGFIASLNMDVHLVVFVKGKLKHEPKQLETCCCQVRFVHGLTISALVRFAARVFKSIEGLAAIIHRSKTI